MVWLKLSLTTLLFFLVALVQTSFLPHVAILGIAPNLVFVLFFILVFFEDSESYQEGMYHALLAGFILDVFSSAPFGYNIISLAIIYIALKITIHFLKERQDKYMALYFVPLFLVIYLCYSVILSLFWGSGVTVALFESTTIWDQLAYNLIIAFIGFLIYQKLTHSSNRQLTLFNK